MTSEEAFTLVVDALHATGVPFMVVGSFASNFYGVPRSTRDADFVVQWTAGSLEALAARLRPAIEPDPQTSFETVTGTTRHVLRVRDSVFVIELFGLSDDAHDQERFGRRVSAEVLGRTVFVPTAEDVIVTKLRWAGAGNRAKDTEDARNVMAVQGASLDWNYLDRWCWRHATRDALAELRRSLPSL